MGLWYPDSHLMLRSSWQVSHPNIGEQLKEEAFFSDGNGFLKHPDTFNSAKLGEELWKFLKSNMHNVRMRQLVFDSFWYAGGGVHTHNQDLKKKRKK